ncbi:GntR family transcriptional regulator [Ochrobactrum chromiisoli]|uniref:GntR family transcriptional regulator n=1 Tax=Ochrobactrum chromiisoli TaxID=2993941 RepID=A0ABT3QSJ8_9HYPH|nr:GntR family transcriptional regulator [Ochrobactrum chromiisoli]MCX2698589.1 GntR family transcriptional regulator [Ochrobactrum chromiisoli]
MTERIAEIRKSAADVVRDGLREAILAGDFGEGQQLRQDEIAVQFGTSRIPVREALRQLEGEGLVELYANRGAVVKGLSIDDVLEMLDIRIALECRALKLAIPNMAIEDFEKAQQILDQYEETVSPEQWGEMNWQFHWTLYLPCGKPKLLAMIEDNYGHVNRFTRRKVSTATGKAKPQKDHTTLLELCRQEATEQAVSLLERHIEATQKSLRAAMRIG